MADVSIRDGQLHISLTVPERVLSLHGREVSIPLERIVSAAPVAQVLDQVRGLRRPGAALPGVLAIGTWGGTERGVVYRDFVVVHRPGPGVVLTLDGEPYDRVLLSAERPSALIAALAR